MSVFENELHCFGSASWRGWAGLSIMESSLFSNLLILTDWLKRLYVLTNDSSGLANEFIDPVNISGTDAALQHTTAQ